MAMLMVPDFYVAEHNQSNPYLNSLAKEHASGERAGEKKRVLVVDDETLIADTLTEILNDSGFEAITAYTAEDAMQLAQGFQPDILMSDVLMPRTNGIELAIAIREGHPATKILLFSGQPSTGTILQNARQQGHEFEVLGKPVLPEQLIAKLKAMCS